MTVLCKFVIMEMLKINETRCFEPTNRISQSKLFYRARESVARSKGPIFSQGRPPLRRRQTRFDQYGCGGGGLAMNYHMARDLNNIMKQYLNLKLAVRRWEGSGGGASLTDKDLRLLKVYERFDQRPQSCAGRPLRHFFRKHRKGKMMRIGRAGKIVLFCLTLLWVRPLDAAELVLFAGAASKPATQELAELFEAETGHKVRIHFGNSGHVLFQMRISRQGDIYFPGSPDFMSQASQENLVTPETIRIAAYLIPAINVQRGNPKQIRSLRDFSRSDVRVAIGNPHTVIVGMYAVEIFDHANLEAEVRPRIVGYAESCAKTVNLLALKGVDAIIGWRVHESWNPKDIETVLLLPEQIPRISYMPISVSSFSKNVELAKEFIEYICSNKGKRIFERWGYLTREEDARRYAPDAVIGGDYTLPERW